LKNYLNITNASVVFYNPSVPKGVPLAIELTKNGVAEV